VPTLLCVPIMVDDVPAALADAGEARSRGADIIEWRVDRLFEGEGDEHGARMIAQLVDACPLPCIVTCRGAHEGGEYDGDDAARVSLYEWLGATPAGQNGRPNHPPRYLDIELSTYERSHNLRQKVHLALGWPDRAGDEGPRLVLSFHDFATRPPTLLSTLGKMRQWPAASVLKLAWKARSIRDNLEAFDMLRERDRPMIALCMGEFGLMSRVLAPKFGGFLTFASLREAAATAPGQPTLADLHELYRFRSIGPATRVYGVIGWPVSHSRSPQLHNAGFERVGHDGVYLPLPIPEEWEHFKASVLAMLDHAGLDFRGASVTLPHKEHLVRLAREDTLRRWSIDELSDACGAANTLVVDDRGACRVMNTDAAAAAMVIRGAMGRDADARALAGVRVCIAGAGGVARAVAAGLVREGAHVIVVGRTRSRADRVAEDVTKAAALGGVIHAAEWTDERVRRCEVFVNATPLGMTGGPDPAACAIPDDVLAALSPTAIVFDTVYNPLETPLIRAAAARGLVTRGGLEMFVEQAALQFEVWTGKHAPREAFRRVALESLAPPTL
jgi:3-dehydroquinate dehydratase / shikimate dehydrogenase